MRPCAKFESIDNDGKTILYIEAILTSFFCPHMDTMRNLLFVFMIIIIICILSYDGMKLNFTTQVAITILIAEDEIIFECILSLGTVVFTLQLNF